MMREAKKRFLAAAAGTGIMAAVFAGTAWAEETRTEITEIELNIESSIEADEDDGEAVPSHPRRQQRIHIMISQARLQGQEITIIR